MSIELYVQLVCGVFVEVETYAPCLVRICCQSPLSIVCTQNSQVVIKDTFHISYVIAATARTKSAAFANFTLVVVVMSKI